MGFIETELAFLEISKKKPPDYYVRCHFLIALIEGLEALDAGETPAIFAPTKRRTWGERPYRVEKLQEEAVKHCTFLRMHGYRASKAYRVVGGPYGVDEDAVKKWCIHFRKIYKDSPTSPERVAKRLNRIHQKLGHPVNLEWRLKRIEVDGKAFREARGPKKAKKAPAASSVKGIVS